MKIIELVNDWKILGSGETVSLPCRLPVSDDTLCAHADTGKGNVIIDVDGAVADLFVSGQFVGRAEGERTLIDVSDYVSRTSEIKLCLNRGGSVNRNVKIHSSNSDTFILPYGVGVITTALDEVGATLSVSVDVRSQSDKKRKLGLKLDVLNGRGKRVCGRKKFYTFLGGDRTITLPIKVRSAKQYSLASPYLYTMSVSVIDEKEEVLDTSTTTFGVCTYGEYSVADKLVGCVMPHSSGVLGTLSYVDGERRKLSAIRDLGYNTVRYIGCPSDNALAVTDELGLRVIVDLLDNWSWPRKGNSHARFSSDYVSNVATAVRSLRNHPSVVMYSIGNAPEESYGRAGADKQAEIMAVVRAMDYSRPITAALSELTPLESELKKEGISEGRINDCANDTALVRLGREVDLFAKRTHAFAQMLDVCGYSGYYQTYPHTNKPVIGLATPPKDYFEGVTEMIKNAGVMGDLSDLGMDSAENGALALGDVDSTCLPRIFGLYRSVLLGNTSAYITTGEGALGSCQHWNYDDGEKVDVKVITAGDVVALYLNGKLVGRKLAGRLNKYVATFSQVSYAPGTLEAVCYCKGREISRVTLETTSKPRAIKVLSGSSTVWASKGELAFFDVWVLDKEGRIVTTDSPEITFEVFGGKVIALGDGYGDCGYTDNITVSNGHALLVVKSTGEDKITVKATGEKLLRGQLTVKVK